MRSLTRIKYNTWLSRQAELNQLAASDVHGHKFTVEPSVEQTLEQRIQESSGFLSSINVVGVAEQSGEKLGLGIGGPIASNTDTGSTDRATSDPSTLDKVGYLCTQTNSDTHLSYNKLDLWAKFPDFQTRIRDLIIQRRALDRMLIGWNGTSRAATSNNVTSPLLQDVNKGWVQKLREGAPARVMSEVVAASGAVRVFSGGDYENLDQLVFDLVNNLIDPWYRESTDVRVIVGRELLADKYFPIIGSHAGTPTEAQALDMLMSSLRIGGLPAVRVPYFPPNALCITLLQNLSIYYQEGSTRRTVIDNPKRDRIETYESVNEAYVVEDFGAMCYCEHIDLSA